MRIRCTNCGIYFFRDSQDEVYTLCDKCLKELIKEGSAPVVPVSASATLSFTGDINQGDTITINGRTYEFDIDGSIRPGNIPIDVTGKAVAATGTLTATLPVVLGDTVTIGTDTYVIAGDSSNPKNINISGGTKTKATGVLTLTDDIIPGVHAESVLTSDGTVPSSGDTVTIGDETYTFVSSLSDPAIPFEVVIGTSAATALDNLKAAINLSAGAGSVYGTGTTKNTSVVATDNTDTTQKVVARVPGTAGNSIAVSETSSHFSWEGSTLGGGVNAETVSINGRAYSFVTVLSEINGADAIADQVLFGSDSSVALDNLKLAVNAEGTAGSSYSTGTIKNADVLATTNESNAQTFEALVSGSAGNAITTTTTIVNGSFGGATLSGGSDATAAEFIAAIVTTINAITGNIVTAENETGGVMKVTAAVAGAAGNSIVTISNVGGATFGAATLTGGKDAGSTDACAETKATINADTVSVVSAETIDASSIKIVAKTPGDIGNIIKVSTDGDNIAFDKASLSGGVNGTPGWTNQILSDGSKLYISSGLSTSTDSNWKEVDINEVEE
ncbi:MAG TPA: hypothetical protein P5513_04340 [Candidatus Diapherotrites archaeon]|nr:hypothetical protein [Candidatus Diapherotrites archaeon]